jgi:hypothetical protein
MSKIERGGYFDECVAFLDAIGAARIAELRVGQESNRGSQSAMHQLGSVVVGSQKHFLGVKVPICPRPNEVQLRAAKEIALIDTILRRVPELRGAMPHFIGVLAVGEPQDVRALLTEDATEGGRRRIYPVPVSERIRRLLFGAFVEEGADPYRTFCESTLERTTAFDDGTRQRLLDFTPPPVLYNALGLTDYPKLNELVMGHMDLLTVTVSLESPLGSSPVFADYP